MIIHTCDPITSATPPSSFEVAKCRFGWSRNDRLVLRHRADDLFRDLVRPVAAQPVYPVVARLPLRFGFGADAREPSGGNDIGMHDAGADGADADSGVR